jgi:SAM-dependent methyltransferase
MRVAASSPEMNHDRASIGDSVRKYNAAYTVKKDFIARPNAFLCQCLSRIAAGRSGKRVKRTMRALDIGLGQGRNAVLMAQRGYHVTGLDRSEVGIRAARRLAENRGLAQHIDAVIADSERFDYGRNRWDLIALLYYPQPMVLMPRLKRAVRPGGCIVIERFSRPNHGKAAHAVDGRETKRTNPMLQAFADWHLLHYENDELKSDWHWDGESPSGPIVRLLARKPRQG